MAIDTVITIGGHLTDRILCDATGASIDLAPLYPTVYQFRLKLVDNSASGTVQLVYPNVTSLNASLGLVYAEPRSGTFKLRYGTATATAKIDFRESPDSFRTKLAALTGSTTYGLQEVYQPNPSTWVCHFDNTIAPADEINGIENDLEPETFIRVYQFQEGPENWVEIRLIQGPIASTNAWDHILAPPPETRRIREGSTTEVGLEVIIINEIQAVYVPPDFTGTYSLKFQGRSTTYLSANDGPQVIEDALNLLYDDNKKRFHVTNPELNNAYIEFIGPLSGKGQPLLEAVVGSTGKADLMFTLNLATEEVEAAIRTNPAVDTTFEIKLHITDATVEGDPGQDVILFQAPVQVLRPLHWDGLQAATPINWLLPPNPVDYIPFTPDQIITGQQSYSAAFGNTTDLEYVIAHELNAEGLSVAIRQNIAGGRLLEFNEYNIEFTNANALKVILPTVPTGSNGFLISIFATGPKSQFQAHTHTMAQIIGLVELLDSILARLSALEALLPSAISTGAQTPFAGTEDEPFVGFDIPDEFNIVPTNRIWGADTFDPKKPESLPSAGYLLPAIHDVIELGNFTVDTATNKIILAIAPATTLAAGQRVRINTPTFYYVSDCTFDSSTDTITYDGAPALANGRRVQFSGGILPTAISSLSTYYVVNATATTFQIASELGGDPIPLLSNGDATVHTVSTISELPGGLSDATDYFALSPTSTQFGVALTIGGDPVDITSAGITPYTISTIEDMNIVPPS